MGKVIRERESDIQAALISWAELQERAYPELKLLYHVPNEGKRTGRAGANLKRQGLRKGVPDLVMPAPKGEYHGLYLEMKTEGGRTSPEQEWWLEQLRLQGYYTAVCWNFEDAQQLIMQYLKSAKSLPPPEKRESKKRGGWEERQDKIWADLLDSCR